MTKNLEDMTYEELLEHQKQAEQLLENQKKEALNSLAQSIKQQIADSPFEMDEVLVAMGVKASASPKKGKVRAKYKHPENPNLTWTGRGRSTPQWALDYLGIEKLDRKNPEHQAKLKEWEAKSR